jgi:predicted signal transduction protein with EAL and GGDEF domain
VATGHDLLRSITQLQINDFRIAAITFESQEGMLITDGNGAILRVNRAFTAITGYTAEEVMGKNALRFFDPQMQETINSRAALESELRKALERQQLHLYYQVQVDNLHSPFGAEALIRWIHPERGLVTATRPS